MMASTIMRLLLYWVTFNDHFAPVFGDRIFMSEDDATAKDGRDRISVPEEDDTASSSGRVSPSDHMLLDWHP